VMLYDTTSAGIIVIPIFPEHQMSLGFIPRFYKSMGWRFRETPAAVVRLQCEAASKFKWC